jgi:TolB-like protein/Flp pilus assembly protein TadD
MDGAAKVRRVIHFGEFELDDFARELRRQGTRLRLQDQPLQLLQILLQRPGEIVTREELQQKVWPSDTFVDFDHGINNAIKRLREALGDTADTPRFVETLPRRGYRFIGKIEQDPPRFRSLVVLPLDNLSRDPEQEYFADGLTEALITTLAKIGELRVVSRTSSMFYKGVRKPLREIARELEVDTVVEGTVLRAGDRVRITAQLIDPMKETHLWAESYDRSLRDILDLQAEVARAIAHEIQIKLTPQEQAQLAQARPVDPEAYEAYLKGRYHWIKRSREGHVRACQYFQQAITKDPASAPPYAGLADAVAIIALWGLLPPEEGCGKARGLALKAIDLDHSLAEAHTSLAWARFHYDYDFITAEKEFERAIELNPRYAVAHHWFGMCLAVMGRYEESYTELKRAVRLDPYSSYIHFGLAFVHWCGRRHEQAIRCCERALELDANSAQVLGWLGLSNVAMMAFGPAIAALQKAAEISQRAPAPLALLGEAYAASGASHEARKILQELTSRPHVTAYFVSRIYAALGDTNETFKWLETSYREHGEWMVLLMVDPRFDSLRDDARFQDLMRRMNFPRTSEDHGPALSANPTTPT